MTAKRVISLVMAALLIFGLAAMAVSAETVDSGTCGENLTWTLDGTTLIISGSGPMEDYANPALAPWYAYRNVTKTVKVENGVTRIGDNAFYGFSACDDFHFGQSVAQIGAKALAVESGGHSKHYYFLCNSPEIAEDAFENRGYSYPVYFHDWDAQLLKNYGGSLQWLRRTLQVKESKQLYELNEEVKIQDLVVKAVSTPHETFDYTPIDVQIGAYDNSTYGYKTVQVHVDGYVFDHTYFVTDGQNHLELVEVELPTYVYYSATGNTPVPVVTAGDMLLKKDTHYTLTYGNNTAVTSDAYVTVKGIGIFAGYEATYEFEILKSDISNVTMYTSGEGYHCAEPIYREATLYKDGHLLKEDQDFVCMDENNVNMGTATVYAAGIGNYYGYNSSQFKIGAVKYSPTLKGAYNGRGDGELNEEMYVENVVISAGTIDADVNCNTYHIAYYELYRLVGEEAVLVTTLETEYDRKSNHTYQNFQYDFSHVYEEENELGGAVYMLMYTWMDMYYSVYSGMLVIGVLSKVPDAATVEMYQIPDDGDFRRDYLDLYSNDGDLGEVSWSSSDESVATVSHGKVTFKKPGTVTITGTGTLSASASLTAQQQDLTQARILGYNSQTGKADIAYQGFLLTEGVDYTLAVTEQGGKTVVTACGTGLFAGQLLREFDQKGAPVDHSHGFDHCEDHQCATCDYIRQSSHAPAADWVKNHQSHWHVCMTCGEKVDQQAHSISPENEDLCTICGVIVMPGDFDGDYQVTDADAIYLLWHTLFPEVYPANQDADVNSDGTVNDADAIYLLWHALFPESYPLYPGMQ